MRTAVTLWLLMALFALRVLGQVLVEFLHVEFLPPSEEWFSGLMPYPQLLTCQVLILGLMTKIGLDFTRQTGWGYRSRVHVGGWLLIFGVVYLAVMIIRYIVRMSLYPHERWTGGSIPIFFHWVLATYVLTLALHHWRVRIRQQALHPPAFWRRALVRFFQAAGAVLVMAVVGLWVGYLLLPSLLAQELGIRPAEYAVRIESSVPLMTSDGVTLAANIYHPRRAGPKTPTILVRIPYSKTLTNQLFASVVGQMWAERGYTVVIQGTRGRYESSGEYDPLRHERQDGIETLEWLARQPWYDGRLGMWGCSYFGYTQWVLADRRDPGPTALIIGEASTDFHRMFHPGGAFALKSALYWAVMSHGQRDVIPSPAALDRGFVGFPLIDADNRAATDIPFFNDWALHTNRNEYWIHIDGNQRPRSLQAPALLIAGWYDPFLPTQLEDFAQIRRDTESRIAAETRLIIGPWSHAETVKMPDGSMSRNFRLESIAPSVAWFDRHLQQRQLPQEAPVRLFVMGRNQWRDEHEWPLARTQYTAYYLHSRGQANTAAGDGTLSRTPPEADEPPDGFDYDPRDPVPTRGGAMLGFNAGAGFNAGIERQYDVESRNDVLVYTTEPLENDLEVTGPVELVLFVFTSAPSTDFTGKLVDVFPDGSAYNVCDGILRRSYDTESMSVVEIRIHLWPTCMVFLQGHRIRLEVSSSNYPRFDRNPNTGSEIATEANPTSAVQTLYHGVERPSHLVLPLISSGPAKE